MPLLMLHPDWPNTFRRTVKTGRKPKRLEFAKGKPVEVTEAEFLALAEDIGLAIFEAELDEKGRPRFVESEPAEAEETKVADHVAHVS